MLFRFLVVSILSLTASVSAQNLIISEVFYDHSSSDDGKEWVELYNAGNSSINLSSYSLGNGDGVTSDIVLTNTSLSTATATVEFRNDDGNPLPIGVASIAEGESQPRFGLAKQSSIEVSIPSLESVTIATDGTGGIVVGSATVTSNSTIGGVFRFFLPGVGIAGVGSSVPYTSFAIPVRNMDGINTGLTFYNPGDQTVDLEFTFRGTGGTLETAAMLDFPGKGHSAQFLNQIFQGAGLENVKGTLMVEVTGGAVAAVALELGTKSGEFTTLPVTEVE